MGGSVLRKPEPAHAITKTVFSLVASVNSVNSVSQRNNEPYHGLHGQVRSDGQCCGRIKARCGRRTN